MDPKLPFSPPLQKSPPKSSPPKLEVKILKPLNQNDKNSPTTSLSGTPKGPAIMNVYARKSLHLNSPLQLDELGKIEESTNIYAKKDSVFDICLSRIESVQENNNMMGSGVTLNGFFDNNNNDNSGGLKILPCFVKRGSLSPDRSPKPRDSKISNDSQVLLSIFLKKSLVFKKLHDSEIVINIYKDRKNLKFENSPINVKEAKSIILTETSKKTEAKPSVFNEAQKKSEKGKKAKEMPILTQPNFQNPPATVKKPLKKVEPSHKKANSSNFISKEFKNNSNSNSVANSPLKPANIVVDLAHLRKIKAPNKKPAKAPQANKIPSKKAIESLKTILSEDISPKLSARVMTANNNTSRTPPQHKHMKSEIRMSTEQYESPNSHRKGSLAKNVLEISVSKIMTPDSKHNKSKSFDFDKFETRPKKIIVLNFFF